MKKDVGIVQTEFLEVKEPLELESGKILPEYTIAYETYGELNEEKDNAILVLHALTGDAHAAGKHSEDDKKVGWWNDMIGEEKGFDTKKYFVISSNMLGGCSGTTGPSSLKPNFPSFQSSHSSGEGASPVTAMKSYGLDFPVFTIHDAVKVQKKLVEHFGVKKLIVAGGSMGGMQALDWTINYPEMVKACIFIASTSKLSAQSIAFNAIGRNAILSDPNFNNGNYYGAEKQPERGLAIARMIGHVTYLCEDAMQNKFSRRFQDKDKPDFDFNIDFEVESYLEHQGQTFVERFDANSYLYITKAVDLYDAAEKHGTLEKAFENVGAKFLIMSFTSDWLFPTSQAKEVVNALVKVHKDVSFFELESPCGHDAFLLEFETQTKIIKSFLNKLKG
jgi:homoserine O-acetyltransferase